MSFTAGNRKDFPCTKCQKSFKSKPALGQHARAKHYSHNTSQAAVGDPSVTKNLQRLHHRGISYSTLSAAEQEAIKGQLSGFCHSNQRLRKEGFVLPASNVPSYGSPQPPETLSCPDAMASMPKAVAIILDCEMAGAAGGHDEVIRITMVDFLTGNTLQDSLVNPSRPITHWREDITGISADSMQRAVAKGDALQGWEAARAELWRFADKETILMGQSVDNDLKVLRTRHTRIIDSAIVTADAVLGGKSKIRKRWGLETLSRELVGIQIRKPTQIGSLQIHDAFEDALATREVLLMCALQPDEVNHWARVTRAAFFKGGDNKRKKPQARGNRHKNIPQSSCIGNQEEVDEEEEILVWDDVVDFDTWPKSPPDSD